MAETNAPVSAAQSLRPARNWLPVVALAWLIPGAGHLMLRKYGRGGLLMGAIVLTFLLGLGMRGSMFEPQTGDLLKTIIYCGGFLGNFASGALYILAKALGYDQPD